MGPDGEAYLGILVIRRATCPPCGRRPICKFNRQLWKDSEKGNTKRPVWG